MTDGMRWDNHGGRARGGNSGEMRRKDSLSLSFWL